SRARSRVCVTRASITLGRPTGATSGAAASCPVAPVISDARQISSGNNNVRTVLNTRRSDPSLVSVAHFTHFRRFDGTCRTYAMICRSGQHGDDNAPKFAGNAGLWSFLLPFGRDIPTR